mmetsp:Transcript_85274/g.275211  ORF Transcript_85274/g.275211 Transcript_85274/m.275211 type:complete len:630 (+) Transcript_85274:424-2313(+)
MSHPTAQNEAPAKAIDQFLELRRQPIQVFKGASVLQEAELRDRLADLYAVASRTDALGAVGVSGDAGRVKGEHSWEVDNVLPAVGVRHQGDARKLHAPTLGDPEHELAREAEEHDGVQWDVELSLDDALRILEPRKPLLAVVGPLCVASVPLRTAQIEAPPVARDLVEIRHAGGEDQRPARVAFAVAAAGAGNMAFADEQPAGEQRGLEVGVRHVGAALHPVLIHIRTRQESISTHALGHRRVVEHRGGLPEFRTAGRQRGRREQLHALAAPGPPLCEGGQRQPARDPTHQPRHRSILLDNAQHMLAASDPLVVGPGPRKEEAELQLHFRLDISQTCRTLPTRPAAPARCCGVCQRDGDASDSALQPLRNLEDALVADQEAVPKVEPHGLQALQLLQAPAQALEPGVGDGNATAKVQAQPQQPRLPAQTSTEVLQKCLVCDLAAMPEVQVQVLQLPQGSQALSKAVQTCVSDAAPIKVEVQILQVLEPPDAGPEARQTSVVDVEQALELAVELPKAGNLTDGRPEFSQARAAEAAAEEAQMEGTEPPQLPQPGAERGDSNIAHQAAVSDVQVELRQLPQPADGVAQSLQAAVAKSRALEGKSHLRHANCRAQSKAQALGIQVCETCATG